MTSKAHEEQGLEGVKEKTRRKPGVKIRVAPELEEAVLNMAYEYPAAAAENFKMPTFNL
jgi:hypothetical protein